MFNSGSMPRREAQIYGQMLDSAINVHHNVTQFPQDLTLHKPRRPGSDSRERERERAYALLGNGNGNKNPFACECEYVNVSACLAVFMLCVCLIKSKGS